MRILFSLKLASLLILAAEYKDSHFTCLRDM